MTTVKPIVEERQHHSWGLLVQGRPATPSEGRAQQYTRIGSKDTQSLITHNNGTCLEFGPWVCTSRYVSRTLANNFTGLS
ncbi:hypothetical protein BCIN_16g04940 [Botrytis cinerea B05.10]|uniref:Uncharacterized protein n=1 Tax=Botryotinia fuckeliana (strain B05.10) TaxID=332648 RepID=A0A384K7S0_BOTFB|nr:hypothetical protein BCIN_16g04940 [Botrytis cinerea B05.10]ATZ58821.1 hypothetical protein BCIN_16g04940 [Botrytis cinerea B05.10]